LAKEIGLNANGFETCLNSGKYQAAIKADIAEGTRVGVSGTPAFFINGRLVSGAQPLPSRASSTMNWRATLPRRAGVAKGTFSSELEPRQLSAGFLSSDETFRLKSVENPKDFDRFFLRGAREE
jgi:hypothetical protein